jgi:hypothetical protein
VSATGLWQRKPKRCRCCAASAGASARYSFNTRRADGAIDVPDGAVSQAIRKAVVLFMRNVPACLAQILERFVNAAAMII